MNLLEDILHEVKTTENNGITNIILQYPDLEGGDFFAKMASLKDLLTLLGEEHDLVLVEEPSIQKKHWIWNLPITFNSTYKFLQFDLSRVVKKVISREPECGDHWRRPSDNTTVEIQAIIGSIIHTRTLSGPGLMNDRLNRGVMAVFWDRI